MDKKAGNVCGYVTAAVPTAKATDTVGDVLACLPGGRFDSIHSIYVLDDHRRLVGAVPLTEIFSAARSSGIDGLMQHDPACVRADLDCEDAASVAIQQDLVVIPVVDGDGRFLGVLPPRALMGVLRDEHLADVRYMASIRHHSDEARRALEAPLVRRARYRLPWLVVGLGGSVLATALLAHFQRILEPHVAIAFFVPAIVYLAEAVGTQSEAVAIRGLMTGEDIAQMLLGEVTAGVLIGLIVALVAGAFTVVAFEKLRLGFAVGSALLLACTIAAVLGLCLPWLFVRAGWDPAHASGPISTIVRHMLGLLVYVGAAHSMV